MSEVMYLTERAQRICGILGCALLENLQSNLSHGSFFVTSRIIATNPDFQLAVRVRQKELAKQKALNQFLIKEIGDVPSDPSNGIPLETVERFIKQHPATAIQAMCQNLDDVNGHRIIDAMIFRALLKPQKSQIDLNFAGPFFSIEDLKHLSNPALPLYMNWIHGFLPEDVPNILLILRESPNLISLLIEDAKTQGANRVAFHDLGTESIVFYTTDRQLLTVTPGKDQYCGCPLVLPAKRISEFNENDTKIFLRYSHQLEPATQTDFSKWEDLANQVFFPFTDIDQESFFNLMVYVTKEGQRVTFAIDWGAVESDIVNKKLIDYWNDPTKTSVLNDHRAAIQEIGNTLHGMVSQEERERMDPDDPKRHLLEAGLYPVEADVIIASANKKNKGTLAQRVWRESLKRDPSQGPIINAKIKAAQVLSVLL